MEINNIPSSIVDLEVECFIFQKQQHGNIIDRKKYSCTTQYRLAPTISSGNLPIVNEIQISQNCHCSMFLAWQQTNLHVQDFVLPPCKQLKYTQAKKLCNAYLGFFVFVGSVSEVR